MADYLTESVFSKDSGLSYKHESRSLCQSHFLVKLQALTINGNDEVVADSVTESVFSLRL